MSIHPKTGGAAAGGTVGVLIVAILQTVGVHMSPELPGAIAAFCGAVGSWLAPPGQNTPPVVNVPPTPAGETVATVTPIKPPADRLIGEPPPPESPTAL